MTKKKGMKEEGISKKPGDRDPRTTLKKVVQTSYQKKQNIRRSK